MDFTLNEEQNKLKAKARDFAIREVLPVARQYDESEEFPLPVIKKAWEEKLLNLGIPKEYGGQGYGLLDACLVVEEISSACPGMATSIFDNNLGAEPIVIGGNDEQKERFLGELVNEFKLIAFATSEPTMGSDVASMKCRAEKDVGWTRAEGKIDGLKDESISFLINPIFFLDILKENPDMFYGKGKAVFSFDSFRYLLLLRSE